ncbi:MAG TPA: T9SS type A sorting domain-containing protein, partial [Flavisolibacter sp.]|nr:T9SS type A sorting domain-containing protein [Flavisolibacter sp.]
DQKTFYIITDSSKTTSGPSGTNPMPVDCQGCLQKYTFMGYFNDPVTKKSTIPNTIDITTTKTPNTCITADSIVITSVNDTLWVPITGPDGNVMAEIKWGAANANTTLKSSFYINSGSMREDAYKRLYLNRNMTITPTVQPTAKPVYIRLYITAAEYLALKAASNSKGQSSGVVLPADLRILKNVDACGGALTTATTNLPTPIVDSQSTKGFVLQDSVTSFSSFYISSGSMVVLPVKLISFKGSLQNDAALLQWSTTNQKSLASFILERSVDGKEFENIATIIPKTSINGNADYSYIDNDASKQTSLIIYYRLRMVDLDQSYSYSDIINVQFNGSFTVFVYPVPIKDELNARITIAKSDNIQVQVSDMQGHIMYEQTRFVSGGTTEMKINTQSWPSQSYFVKVIAGDNKMIVTKKVIKL